jgi:transposase
MTNQRHAATFKAQAVEGVWRKTMPARVTAAALGVPRKTRYRWLEVARHHPAAPCVGSGHVRADDQRVRDRERANRDGREGNAILNRVMRLCTHDGK